MTAQNTSDKAAAAAPKKKKTASELEAEIMKWETKVAAMKHIDAKDLGVHFMFPLLRLLAQVSTDQDGQIGELTSSLKDALDRGAITEGGDDDDDDDDDIGGLIEDAMQIIMRQAVQIDALMMAGGFLVVDKKKRLASTGVLEKSNEGRAIFEEYAALQNDVPEIVSDLKAVLDEEENEDPPSAVDANDRPRAGAPVGRLAAVAPANPAPAAAAAVADVVVGGGESAVADVAADTGDGGGAVASSTEPAAAASGDLNTGTDG